MVVNREAVKERVRYHFFEKEAFSQHVSGPDYDFFVSSALPLLSGTLGGMRYGTGGKLFPNGGDFPKARDAGNVVTRLHKGMTKKYSGDLIPRRYLEEEGLLNHEESKRADFLGAKMVIRDKDPRRAEKVMLRAESYDEEVQALFEKAGAFVEGLNFPNPSDPRQPNITRFYNTAPDSNTSTVKMTYVRKKTDRVHCLPDGEPYFGSGDPSIVTATGLVGAIKAIRERHFPAEDFLDIGMLGGAGSVGSNAIRILREYEASGYLGFKVNLTASDIPKNHERLGRLSADYGFDIVPEGTEHRNVHVWSTNGFIGSVKPGKVSELRERTTIIGAENEQLPENPFDPYDQGVARDVNAIYATLKRIEGYYSPDFVNNNGGIHDVNCLVMFGREGYSKERAIQTMLEAGQAYVGAVYDQTRAVQEGDRRRVVHSHVIAEEMALDALVDRIIERRDEVVKGPFAAYFVDVL
ncbi:MAG: hypothetical protein AABX98_04610 [Nanoarchaeota archaeon]